MLKLGLSGRLIEIQYRRCEMGVPDFIRFAGENGYKAVELRSTQITMNLTEKELKGIRKTADELGLEFSSVFIPKNIPADNSGLRTLEEFAYKVQMLGCVTLKSWDKDSDWIRRECDILKSLGMELIIQTHTGGPLENTALCLDTLKRINRENFGLQYDPANFFEANEDYREDTVKKLGKHIKQLSVQNCRSARPEDKGNDVWEHEGRRFKRVLPGDPTGLDYVSVFRGLKAVGFNGYVIVNESMFTQMEAGVFARRAVDELQKLILS